MRIFKTRLFNRWAAEEGLTDRVLADVINEMERGLVDANLGGHVYKKRVALPGRGKRGGSRTLLAYRKGEKAFFVMGFAKNERANIDARDLKALGKLADELLGYTNAALKKLIKHGQLIEIEVEDNE